MRQIDKITVSGSVA